MKDDLGDRMKRDYESRTSASYLHARAPSLCVAPGCRSSRLFLRGSVRGCGAACRSLVYNRSHDATLFDAKRPDGSGFSGENLRLLVQLLLDACTLAGHAQPQVALTATLWGFARSEGEVLQARLEEQIGSGVRLRDPDTLELVTPSLELTGGTAPIALESYLEGLAELHDESLLLELRLRFAVPQEKDERAFVLHGVLERGTFVLQGLWRTGDGDFQDEMFQFTPWPEEKKLLQKLHDFSGGESGLDAAFCKELFPDRASKATGGAIVWLLSYKTPQEWFQRLGVTLGLFLGLLTLLTTGSFAFLGIFLGMGLALSGLAFVWLLGYRLFMIHFCRTQMYAMNQRLYTQPLTFTPVDLSQDPVAQSDIALRKLTQDIESLGATHVQDVESSALPKEMGAFLRLFLTDDGTALMLILMHHNSQMQVRPSKANFLVRTELEDESRCVTINNDGGYRKPFPGLDVVARVFTKAKHPGDLLRKHRYVLELTEQQRGTRRRKLAPHEILETELAYHEQIRKVMQKVGYFGWDDAFRMSFQAPLPEYQKDEIA
jgi:hypothetical protein